MKISQVFQKSYWNVAHLIAIIVQYHLETILALIWRFGKGLFWEGCVG